jgi:hypothetical protein
MVIQLLLHDHGHRNPIKICNDPTRRQKRLENVRRLVKSPYGLKQAPVFRAPNLTTS